MLSTQIIYLMIASTLLVLLFLTAYIWQKHQTKHEAKLQAIGIKAIFQLRELFSLLQQHRGLSNGLYKGDITLKDSQKETAFTVDEHINTMQKTRFNNKPLWELQPRFESITEHWQRFSTSTTAITASNNLEQHNKLVLNTLYLIDDIAEQFHLHKLVDDKQESIRHLWLELLFTVENIGQIRALGTGVAAAKLCSHVELLRLNYLSNSVLHTLNNYLTEDNSAHIEQLINVLESQVLHTPPTIDAKEFFALASACIDDVLSTFDKQLTNIKLA